METIVTSFGTKGYGLYGWNFLNSFALHWPGSAQLICYREGNEIHHRTVMRDLLALETFQSFAARYADDPVANGNVAQPCWRQRERDNGHSFRTDAMKFCRKVFAVEDAAHRLGSGLMAWIDADVVTMNQMPRHFLHEILEGKDYAYLGRDRVYSECGFLAFRLPQAMPIIESWAAFYNSGSVFDLPETHDSFVFDRARDMHPDVPGRDLTPGGYGHTWLRSPLARYMVHLKGDLKNTSMEQIRRHHGQAKA